jgi:hypothetical protein
MKIPGLFSCAPLALSLFAPGCGYHVSGHGDTLPKTLKTIAVPAFKNATVRYRLTNELPAAITREFISRTRYRVVTDPSTADAVLNGSIVKYDAYPTAFDPATGRASLVLVFVHLQMTLTERATGKVLYFTPDFEVRERYEISTDPRAYLEESDAAVARLSKTVATQIVSAVLEKF